MTTHISTISQLQAMESNLSEDYVLDNDIDASATSGWNGGAGFSPIGDDVTPFSGSFDGQNHTITNLFIARPAAYMTGLFGGIYNGAVICEIKNISLLNVNITGGFYSGALIGQVIEGNISNCMSSGTVGGQAYVGGLIGEIDTSAVSHCYSVANVEDTDGGLSGGLLGQAWNNNTIENSYARGNVVTTGKGAGFIGRSFTGSGDIVAITNCYSTGEITINEIDADVYGFGYVSGIGTTTALSCYWDTESSGVATSPIGNGKITSQMKTKSTFIGWNFASLWTIGSSNDGYPYFGTSAIATPGALDIPSLEAIRNIEMSAMGRAYVDEEGNFIYESRFSRYV